MMVDLRVDIAGINMNNPVMSASGCFGYGKEYAAFYKLKEMGALVVKGTTLEPREGNSPPRIAETPAGILNAVGLQNPGIDYVIREELPALQGAGTPVIINIAGNLEEEYIKMVRILDPLEEVQGLEVNISCPNVKLGGMAFGTDQKVAGNLVKAIRSATSKPLIVKLSPNVTDIKEVARAVEEEGADAISLVNTFLGMAIDIHRKKPVLGNLMGGLSGPAIKPLALRMVWQVSQEVKVPVIGMGGIMTAEDALEFIMAGARAVAVGTANFVNPYSIPDIVKGIGEFMVENNYDNLLQLTGAAWRGV
ncbi:MAG: dihydroorotate dehydrogenase [Tindallia sp. MSAO_Bac2]|nr:MAG: dihydroorotate dehydrogenase [Tindallia sp. MSAO_Bac2]